MQGLIEAGGMPEQPQESAKPEQPDNARNEKVQQIILAAQKLMYSDKVKFVESLGEGEPAQVAADAAVSVMLILIQESGFKIDPSLIIPAGTVVVGDILDFIGQAKDVEITEDIQYFALETFVKQMMEAVQGEGNEPPAEEQSEPIQAEQSEGLIGRAA